MGVGSGTPQLLRKRFYSKSRDIVFINPFLLRAELSPDVVAILECTERTESGMRAFFQITDPQNQEDNFDPHEPQVLFLVTPGKQDYLVQAAPRNLSDLEEPPKSPENE